MHVCFVSSGGVAACVREGALPKNDLTICCFEEGGVSYQGELRGETCLFEEIAMLSKKGGNVVVCGTRTEAYGWQRKSIVVAEKGKILGVADMTHAWDGKVSCGAHLRLFDTALGKMGVVVAEDLYFPETVRALCDCGCEYLVCSFDRPCGALEKTLLRALAFFYGTPFFFCGKGGGMIADGKGEERFFSPDSPVCVRFEGEKAYHLVERRQRGFLGE